MPHLRYIHSVAILVLFGYYGKLADILFMSVKNAEIYMMPFNGDYLFSGKIFCNKHGGIEYRPYLYFRAVGGESAFDSLHANSAAVYFARY